MCISLAGIFSDAVEWRRAVLGMAKCSARLLSDDGVMENESILGFETL